MTNLSYAEIRMQDHRNRSLRTMPRTPGSTAPPSGTHIYSGVPSPGRSLQDFEREIVQRLEHGEHVVLYGPLGSGKSTLLAGLYRRVTATGIPCALWTAALSLEDITSALALAYPHVNTETTQRRGRGRLWLAAERERGVFQPHLP